MPWSVAYYRNAQNPSEEWVYWTDFYTQSTRRSHPGSFINETLPVAASNLIVDDRPSKKKLYYFDQGVLTSSNLDGTNAVQLSGTAEIGGLALNPGTNSLYIVGDTTPHPGTPTYWVK